VSTRRRVGRRHWTDLTLRTEGVTASDRPISLVLRLGPGGYRSIYAVQGSSDKLIFDIAVDGITQDSQ
jgi:hypothetical protein